MAAPGAQRWLTSAGTEEEAWKCLLLARSLRRSLTTRPLALILSESVGKSEIGLRLQMEFDQVLLAPKAPNSLEFSAWAKVWAESEARERLRNAVFLNNNSLLLKNADEVFRKEGVHFAGDKKVALMVKPRAVTREGQRQFVGKVAERESGGKWKDSVEISENVNVVELKYCHEIDMNSAQPVPLPYTDVRMVYFVNGHPLDWSKNGKKTISDLKPKRQLENAMIQFTASLCPELFSQKSAPPQPSLPTLESELNSSLAIVGMACRYPGANTMDDFWRLLEQGIDGMVRVPEGRWTKDNAFIRMDNIRATEAGFLACPVDTFDSKFFNTNAADMAYMDPQQRLTLRVVWEALEHSGIDALSLKNSLTGVFGGWWRNDYKEMLQMLGFADADFLRGYMGNALGPFTARISHFFDLIGPSYSTESGCSTSVAGVDMACDSLKNEACDLAICVGANLLLHPFPPGMMEGVLAPDGRCKTFDSSADGFGRAEGIGVLILKRFSDAVAHGDRVWGLIRGSAIVQEGTSKSMGTPTVDVEARAMQLALQRSGVDPDEVEFVEMHGTGTPVGDPIEVLAVEKAYGSTRRKKPLTIGSVKTNIGHTESVCGIAGIQKTLLSMKHNLIPKHLHLKELNSDIDLTKIPAQLPLQNLPWPKRKDGKLRLAGVNSFGITGAQAHVVLQEPPSPTTLPKKGLPFKDSRSVRLLTLSAKTEEALQAQITAYKDFLLANPEVNLASVEFTNNTGRPHYPLRHFVVGSTPEELIKGLDALPGKAQAAPPAPPKLCVLFTGQGSQYIGMAKAFYEGNALFRSYFDWFEALLQQQYGVSLVSVLWDESKAALLKTTLYVQISIFVVELCLLKLWESWGIKPDAVMGHSLGEVTAVVAAGVMTPQEALKLLITRSDLIDSLPSGSMLVVGCSVEKVKEALSQAFSGNQDKWLDITCINAPNQTVLGGPTNTVVEFAKFCANNGIKAFPLETSHAFHSRMLDPMMPGYEAALKEVNWQPGNKAKLISTVEGNQGQEVENVDIKYSMTHTRNAVHFMTASQSAVKNGYNLFLEVGPQPVLSALVLANADGLDGDVSIMCLPSLRKKYDEWATILSTLGRLHSLGFPINWDNFHRYTDGEVIDLPGYHFDESPYWMPIKDEGTIPFHPLVGASIPNPSELGLFKSSVDVHKLPWLRDHSLGDKIIFPCAGYVDMALTAGYATTCGIGQYQRPTQPLNVRNFAIMTPICLSEMQATEFQVVVSKTPEGEIESTIFTRLFVEDEQFKWVKNAKALFSPSPQGPPPEITLEGIRSRCSKPVRPIDYIALQEFGFHFGPSLQTVLNGWTGTGSDGEQEFLFKFGTYETEEDYQRFALHPWILDVMLQAQITALGFLEDDQTRQKRLVVPVQVDSYTWWGLTAPKGFVYTKHTETQNEAHLFDEEGRLLASMVGTEFMETTLSNILALIDSHRNPYPSLAEVVWKERLGPEERRVPDDERGTVPLQEIAKEVAPTFTKQEAEFAKDFEKLAGLYMLKAMKELGLDSEKEFTWPAVGRKLQVLPQLDKFLRYILHELAKDGWLSIGKSESFKISKPFPSAQEVKDMVASHLGKMRAREFAGPDLDVAEAVWSQLIYSLTTPQGALPLLYKESAAARSSSQILCGESVLASNRFALNKAEAEVLSRLSKMGTKSVIRVLEVGGGDGAATAQYIKNMLEAGPSHFEYTFTDIVPNFLEEGERLFDTSGISSKFMTLDVEKDPISQGFVPGYYDVIVSSWVFHGTKRIGNCLLNLRKLLKPSGYLLFSELVYPSRAIDLTIGGLEEFWHFEDTDVRPWNCELALDKWKLLLNQCGYKDVVTMESYGGTNALIMAKMGELSKKPIASTSAGKWIVFGDEGKETKELVQRLSATDFEVSTILRTDVANVKDPESKIKDLLSSVAGDEQVRGVLYLWGLDPSLSTKQITEPFLYISKALVKIQKALKVLAFTRGNMCTDAGDYLQAVPHAAPLVSMVQVLGNENQELECKCVDMDASPYAIREALTELFQGDVDSTVAFRKGQRLTPRLRPYKVKNLPLVIPSTSRYRMVIPKSHLIPDLTFAPCDPETIRHGDIEIEVKAYALNFLDVFMVTKPDPVFNDYNYVGVDFAGIVTAAGTGCERKVGDRVVVMRRHGHALPSHVVYPEFDTLQIPDEMTFTEAATFPLGVLTVVTCLYDVAEAKEGDIVLIHTASGGVGVLAIQLARRRGCTVVCTAGNERKRNYLRGLGVEYVFNSRTTDYEKDIRDALGGNKITIVLNSLTSPGFKEATLNLCAPKARFIEMSKMNIWQKKDVKELRPDVFYEVVDVSKLPDEKCHEMMNELRRTLASEDVKMAPVPYVRFDATEIREALEYMEKVKHIGKVVIKMPEASTSARDKDLFFPLFYPESTYVISGGLGGIGLEVAKWMTTTGAKNLLLLGRSTPSATALEKIEAIRQNGVRVEIRSCDVGDFEQLKKIFDEAKETMLPIRGIMHAAGVLRDAPLEEQTWEKYETVFRSKVEGGWNLHKLSQELHYPLEHFVLFSSMSAPLGAVAQSNYAAANQYLDSLCHFRHSVGLPGTTVNWGLWAQVGMGAEGLSHTIFKPFSVNQGLAALEHALKSHRTQVLAYDADLSTLKQVLPSTRGFLQDVDEGKSDSGRMGEIDGDELWREYDACKNREERYDVVKKFLKKLIRLTLKMDKNEEIGDDVAFQDMGMDSLMMVEMKNGLQASVGKRVKISINAVKDCKTPAQLSDRLVDLISGKEEAPAPSSSELLELARKDAQLPESVQVTPALRSTLVPVSKIRNIFFTGATGTLGPYVLRELFALRPHVSKVYCLMQHNPIISPEERFRKVLEKKGLLSSIPMDKIAFVVGDLKAKNFGLSDSAYQKLAGGVDAIFNLAVKVAFEEAYSETIDPKSSRVNNVWGMRNILDFAVSGDKLKQVYHASTFAAECQVGEDGLFWESWPKEEEVLLFPNSAYSISKLICDRMAEQAVEKGVPIKVIRLPQIGGDYERGGNIQLEGFMMMRFLAYLYIGVMPDQPLHLSLMPVDVAANLSVKLFFNEDAKPDIYNLLNPHLGNELDFPTMATEFGVNVKPMNGGDFVAQWKSMDSKDEMIELIKFALSSDSELFHLRDHELPYYTSWKAGNTGIFWSKKLGKLMPDEYPKAIPTSWETLRKDLIFCRDNGVFERYRIKPNKNNIKS